MGFLGSSRHAHRKPDTHCPCFTNRFLHYHLIRSSQGRQSMRTIDPILQMWKVRMETAVDQQVGHLSSSPLSASHPVSLHSHQPPIPWSMKRSHSPHIRFYRPGGGRIFALFVHSFIHRALPLCPGPNIERTKINWSVPSEKPLLYCSCLEGPGTR